MLNKSFTLASAISLTGAVVWLTSASACGGDEETPPATTSSSSSGGDAAAASSSGTSGSTSSSGSSTSGDPFADAGLVDPATVQGVTVTYGKCDAFAKCDGPIEGNWDVSGGCLSDTTFDGYRKICAGLKEHDVVIKASGSVEATATTVAQKTSVFLSVKLDVPKICASFFGGSCSALNEILKSGAQGSSFDHVVCVDSADGATCNCAADVSVTEPGAAEKYDTDGAGILSTHGDPERTFEYCPKGNSITYRETTKDNRTFGMFLTITKK